MHNCWKVGQRNTLTSPGWKNKGSDGEYKYKWTQTANWALKTNKSHQEMPGGKKCKWSEVGLLSACSGCDISAAWRHNCGKSGAPRSFIPAAPRWCSSSGKVLLPRARVAIGVRGAAGDSESGSRGSAGLSHVLMNAGCQRRVQHLACASLSATLWSLWLRLRTGSSCRGRFFQDSLWCISPAGRVKGRSPCEPCRSYPRSGPALPSARTSPWWSSLPLPSSPSCGTGHSSQLEL